MTVTELERQRFKRYYLKIKHEVFSAIGGKCVWCGETDYSLLCLDHVNNDGETDLSPSEHRNTSLSLWRKAKRECYPSKYQLLCEGCNLRKEHSLVGSLGVVFYGLYDMDMNTNDHSRN